MNQSQLSGTDEMQENSEKGNPGVWSSWRRCQLKASTSSVTGQQDWQRPDGENRLETVFPWDGDSRRQEPRASPEQMGSLGEWGRLHADAGLWPLRL